MDNCNTCKYRQWRRWLDDATEKASPHGLQCRKNSPVLFKGDGFGIFPRVRNDEWCGEYEPSQDIIDARKRKEELPELKKLWKAQRKNLIGYPSGAAFRLLDYWGIESPIDFSKHTRKEALGVRWVGKKGLSELEVVMNAKGIYWLDENIPEKPVDSAVEG